jgi:hypothetical protein
MPAADLRRLARDVKREAERLPRKLGHAAGKVGKEQINLQAERVFGADRKFSNSQFSRSARRKATVYYKMDVGGNGAVVHLFPSGDPWYITVLGRDEKVQRPRKKKALSTPFGVYAKVKVGALPKRPERLFVVVPKINKALDKPLQEVAFRSVLRAVT